MCIYDMAHVLDRLGAVEDHEHEVGEADLGRELVALVDEIGVRDRIGDARDALKQEHGDEDRDRGVDHLKF